MTALFRGHRLYVHCSGGRVAVGSITLRGTLAVNSLPLMVMSAAVSGVITPATMLLNRPVPSGLTRTTESHRTFGPMTGVRPAKRGVPRPRSTPMMYSPPIACVGAIGPAIRRRRPGGLVLQEDDLVGHHVQARVAAGPCSRGGSPRPGPFR